MEPHEYLLYCRNVLACAGVPVPCEFHALNGHIDRGVGPTRARKSLVVASTLGHNGVDGGSKATCLGASELRWRLSCDS